MYRAFVPLIVFLTGTAGVGAAPPEWPGGAEGAAVQQHLIDPIGDLVAVDLQHAAGTASLHVERIWSRTASAGWKACRHVLLLTVLLVPGAGLADEIEGRVEQIEQSTVVIQVSATERTKAGSIRAGATFRVVVEIPGVGEAKVANGKIDQVAEGTLTGTIERSSGKVVAGQKVWISADVAKPTSRPNERRSVDSPPTPIPRVDRPPPSKPAASRFPTADLKSRLSGQTEEGRAIVRGVAQAVAQLHLSAHPVDDEIGRRTLLNLIRKLDNDALFFTQQDLNSFTRLAHLYDDQLRAGSIEFAYEIFQTYLVRLKEGAALADGILDDPVDFTVDEQLVLDPEQKDFAADDGARREVWRKWIKYHLLTHKALGANLTQAKARTSRAISDLLRRMHEVDDAALLDTTLQCLMTAYDPRCVWYSEQSFQEQNTQLASELTGIGAALEEEDGYIIVNRVLPGGAAAKDGRLQSGDRVLAVGQGTDGTLVEVIGKPLRDVVQLVRGPVGSTVRLRVTAQGGFESYVYQLTRERVTWAEPESTVLTGADLPVACDGKLGFISLPSLYRDPQAEREGNPQFRSTARDLRPMLQQFDDSGVDLVVVDLRNNLGGPLEETIDTTALFLGSVPSLLSRDRDGNVQSYANEAADLAWAGPLVLLTDRWTSGGPEILAAAVQDHQRGLVIGDPATFGMGTIRSFYDVGQAIAANTATPHLGYILVTNAKFYRPQGRSLQRVGVQPDVTLPSPTADVPIGEGQQPFALGADEVDPILSTGFGYGASDELRSKLQAASQIRQTASAWFRQLKTDATPVTGTPRIISLQESKFMEQYSQSGSSAPAPSRLPGTQRVAADDYLKEALTIAIEYASELRLQAGDRFYVRGVFEDAIEHYRSSARMTPASPVKHYKLAWALATCTSRELRDGEEAVRHAQRANELAQKPQWQYRLALAVAHAEAGQFAEANEWLTSAFDLAPAEVRSRYEFLRGHFAAGRAY